MKKLIATILTLALALTALLGLVSCKGSGDGEISVFYYTNADPYISTVRASMDKLLNTAGLKFQNYDANGSQTTQTEQVTTAIAKGSRALIVNLVDTNSDDAAQNIVNMAKEKAFRSSSSTARSRSRSSPAMKSARLSEPTMRKPVTCRAK